MMNDELKQQYNHERSLTRAKELLKNSTKVAVLSGAGISAESGISTFRDTQASALWNRFDPVKLATMSGFEEDPPLVWEWYMDRIDDNKAAKPNDGHVALGQLEAYRPVTIVTQNVDDLHECGGSHEVYHLHGDLRTAKCFSNCGWSAPVDQVNLVRGTTPSCPSCGGMARPNVVWFGEMLDQTVVDAATQKFKESDLLIVVGTSGQVYPAASYPWYTHARGGKIISINTRPSDHCQLADVVLNGKAGSVLRELIKIFER